MPRKLVSIKASSTSMESAFSEATEGESIYNITTRLPHHPVFASYRVSTTFRNIHGTTDPDILRGGLKGIIFDYSAHSGHAAGSIGERTSLLILVESKVTAWLKDLGLPLIVFSGIHNSTFYVVSSGRMRMSVDLYIDRFLPALSKTLREETNSKEIQATSLTEAILLPLFQIKRSRHCLPRGKLLVDFTSANRGFFTKGGIQRATEDASDSQPNDNAETRNQAR